ncbi:MULTISPECIES: hypothetical protein [Roseateles]|nr:MULTISPECIES: hypothetical protein [Roseateles]WIV97033.1 hypothetical protein K9V56_018725 [Paucibacter aquatile]
MALMITDTGEGNPQGMPCALARGLRMQALPVFVGLEEGALWR